MHFPSHPIRLFEKTALKGNCYRFGFSSTSIVLCQAAARLEHYYNGAIWGLIGTILFHKSLKILNFFEKLI